MKVLFPAKVGAPVGEEVHILPPHLFPHGLPLRRRIVQRDLCQDLLFARLGIHVGELKVVKNEEGYIVKGFFKAFKENFKKSTIIWLILLVIGGFLGADLYLTSSAKGSVGMALRAIFAALELLVLAVGIYAFALTARYENSIKGTIRNALTLTLARFPSSILMVAIMIALIGISIWNLQLITFALPFWALFGVSIIFWINSKLLRRIFAGIEDHTEEEVEE